MLSRGGCFLGRDGTIDRCLGNRLAAREIRIGGISGRVDAATVTAVNRSLAVFLGLV